jgi:hypothetical protein
MRKILTAAVAALTLGGAIATTATQADAAPWHGGGGGWHGGGWRGGGGYALGAGLLGLAVGASLAGPRYYDGPPPAYYDGPGYYGYYGGCRTHWRWDPYWRRYVEVQRCY